MSTTRRWAEIDARRRERYGRIGREWECEIGRILESSGKFASVQFHTPNSKEDRSGSDFTVTLNVNGELRKLDFGVTMSHRRWQESRQKHPDKPQFHFPLGTNPQTIVRRVYESVLGA